MSPIVTRSIVIVRGMLWMNTPACQESENDAEYASVGLEEGSIVRDAAASFRPETDVVAPACAA
jgi:hypothetical protein